MKKRTRASTGVKRASPYGKQTQHQARTKRIVIITLSIVLVAAAFVGITIYRASNRGTATTPPSGYTVSGTVRYAGSQSGGRVYLEVADSNGRDTGIGTSIASPQSYAIRSLPSGTYRISAWMDTGSPQTGIPNALSPNGGISVTVNNRDVSGQNVAILDPSPVPGPAAPVNVRAAPGNGSALVQWVAPQADNGNVLAEYYNVYYDTSSTVSPSAGTRKSVHANNHVFVSGLNDGATYYFVVTAVLGGVESPPSTPATSVTVGATQGPNTISGTISFPSKATGPMYVGVTGQNGAFFQHVEEPASPQSYSISGVPGGSYAVFALVDMNNNGVIDTGDLNKTSNDPTGGNTVITVGADMAGVNRTLIGTNVLARVITTHFSASSSSSSDIYSLEFEVAANVKLPVTVAVLSGPIVTVPEDIGGNYYYRIYQTLNVKPKEGNSYVLAISYSDGTSEKVRVSVTAVLDSLAQNLTTSGTDRNRPTFNWTAPASPPSDYTYLIQVGQRNIGQEWIYPQNGSGMPPSQTSVLYNVDGGASLTSLQTGTSYDWLIYVIDSNGNQAIYQSSYTP